MISLRAQVEASLHPTNSHTWSQFSERTENISRCSVTSRTTDGHRRRPFLEANSKIMQVWHWMQYKGVQAGFLDISMILALIFSEFGIGACFRSRTLNRKGVEKIQGLLDIVTSQIVVGQAFRIPSAPQICRQTQIRRKFKKPKRCIHRLV